MTYAKRFEEVEKELLVIHEKVGLLYYDGVYDDYQRLKKLRIDVLQSQKEVGPEDVFANHFLLDRFYKGKKAKDASQTSFDELDVASYMAYYKQEGINLLDSFYSNGEVCGFNRYDGDIEVAFSLIEEEDYVDLYAYYAYYGK